MGIFNEIDNYVSYIDSEQNDISDIAEKIIKKMRENLETHSFVSLDSVLINGFLEYNYKCEKCGIRGCGSKDKCEYPENFKNWFLTCDEMIIKDIIE